MTLYAIPRHVASLRECDFYHTTELPELGLVKGDWDLRPGLDDYVGHVDCRGRRVLDVGAASGFVSFALERLGAEVVALNLSAAHGPDLVPYAGVDLERRLRDHRARIERLNNAFWLCHRLYRSQVRLVHGTAYAVPEEIGPVDVAMFGCVLLHLRDPFLALTNALRQTRHTAIVTEPVVLRSRLKRLLLRKFFSPAPLFLPDQRKTEPPTTWWVLPPELIQKFLGILGFEDTRVTYHWQRFQGRPVEMFTVVGRRRLSGRAAR